MKPPITGEIEGEKKTKQGAPVFAIKTPYKSVEEQSTLACASFQSKLEIHRVT